MTKIDPKRAVDLGALSERAAVAEEAAKAQEREESVEGVKRWDRAMTKTFRGIHRRPLRLAALTKVRERLEANDA